MTRPRKPVPSFRRHRPSGRAYSDFTDPLTGARRIVSLAPWGSGGEGGARPSVCRAGRRTPRPDRGAAGAGRRGVPAGGVRAAGYEVETVRHPLDERFPEWGESPYFSVTIRRTAPLSEVLTRTGRRFFTDPDLERRFLDRVRAAVTTAGLWESLNSTWVCLYCELMPWSAKAQELLKSQYAAVGSAGRAALPRAVASLASAASRLGGDEKAKLDGVAGRIGQRGAGVGKFVDAYRHYCWPVNSLTDLKLAPFHLLASEGKVHTDKTHVWHLDTLATVCRADPELLLATSYTVVDVTDPASVAGGIEWWTALTARGGEGMVVKPLDFLLRGKRGLAQPAVKCRGPEYLRIIYGPDYDAADNLSRLRSRGLSHKRSLALGEFALGVEGLERFVRREPLRRVHECVFGVLALESEPVDPRL